VRRSARRRDCPAASAGHRPDVLITDIKNSYVTFFDRWFDGTRGNSDAPFPSPAPLMSHSRLIVQPLAFDGAGNVSMPCVSRWTLDTGSSTATPTPPPPPHSASSGTTVDFNTGGPSANSNLKGTFWNIQWGSTAWYYSSRYGGFATNNIGFRNSTTTNGTLTLPAGTRLVSIRATNPASSSNSTASTVTIGCPGQPTVSQSVALNATVTLTTNWTAACSAVTVTSSNSWDTNFDDLIYE
jgi:hypothetical protein